MISYQIYHLINIQGKFGGLLPLYIFFSEGRVTKSGSTGVVDILVVVIVIEEVIKL